MKTVISQTCDVGKPWYTNYNDSDQSMTLSFRKDIEDADIEHNLSLLSKMVSFLPVKTLLINDSKLKKDPLRFCWKIVEVSWEAIHRNGGNRIVVIHQSDLSSNMTKPYSDAMKAFGLPVKLEFKLRKENKKV